MIDNARRNRITIAVVILLYGVVFLLRALGVLRERWWAMLVAAVAVYFLLEAWLRYQMHARLVPSVVVMAMIGLTMLLASLVLYQQWTWAVMWPVAFLFVGAVFLLRAVRTT
jgi:hypothetical protein